MPLGVAAGNGCRIVTTPPDDRDSAPTPTRPKKGWREWLFGGAKPAATAAAAREMPSRIGRYRVLRKLGQGGMGIVYAAEDEGLGRQVALKTIADPDESARRRFRREARAAASVNHPHVCQLFEIAEDSGRLFITMELLEGEPLSGRLRRGPLPVAEALKLGREMLSALGALHGHGIVHRDLKPSNVFLTPHGTKLLDFGLARPLPDRLTGGDGESVLTQSGQMVGTPRYMAPEQVQGGEVDARTDVFAAGAVLFETLAGRPAFAGSTAVEVLYATLHEQPPALTGSSGIVAFDRVIRRALAKEPRDRYATAEAMDRDLAAVSLSDSGEAASQARAVTRLVVMPFRLLRPDPEIDFLQVALSDAISASLSGLPALVVRSTTAGSRFAADVPDLKALAAELDVDLVLLGTLLRSGERLRVSTQLVEAPAGTIVRSHTAQSEVGDVFRLQDELARGIVESLSLSLGAGRERDRRAETPASARAYEFYLRANELGRDIFQLPLARDLYLRCVDEDPGFAPAWARLGRAHRVIGKFLDFQESPRHRALAEEAFRKALALSPDLPVAHKFYAHLESEMGRAKDAMVRLVRLASQTRNDPELFAGLVHACRYCGLTEASLAAHREAHRLDPTAPTSVVHTLWNQGDFEAILRAAGDEADIVRPMALHAVGRTQEAIDLWEAIVKQFPTPYPPDMRLWIEGVRGVLSPSEAGEAALLEGLALEDDPESTFMDATYMGRLGLPGVVEQLARAVDAGYSVADALVRHPWLEGVRTAPGFADVLERAQRGREQALVAFREAGGDRLLGVDHSLP
jgi:TolB-like protein